MKQYILSLLCSVLLYSCIHENNSTTCNNSPEPCFFNTIDTNKCDVYVYKSDTLIQNLYLYYFYPGKIHYSIETIDLKHNCSCYLSDTGICESWGQDPSTDEDELNSYTLYPTYDFLSKKIGLELNIAVEPSRGNRARIFSYKKYGNCLFTSPRILKKKTQSKTKQYPPELPQI